MDRIGSNTGMIFSEKSKGIKPPVPEEFRPTHIDLYSNLDGYDANPQAVGEKAGKEIVNEFQTLKQKMIAIHNGTPPGVVEVTTAPVEFASSNSGGNVSGIAEARYLDSDPGTEDTIAINGYRNDVHIGKERQMEEYKITYNEKDNHISKNVDVNVSVLDPKTGNWEYQDDHSYEVSYCYNEKTGIFQIAE